MFTEASPKHHGSLPDVKFSGTPQPNLSLGLLGVYAEQFLSSTMTKRKAVVGHDAASVPADDAPTLSKQENEAWAFFQDFECSEVVELFSESRFLASSGNRIMDLLDRVQPHIRSYRHALYEGLRGRQLRFPSLERLQSRCQIIPKSQLLWSLPRHRRFVQRPLFDAMSSLARLDSTFLIPKTTSVFSIPSQTTTYSIPAPSSTPRYHLRGAAAEEEDVSPPKSSTKGPVIKAERVLPKPKPRNRKSAPEATAEAPRRSKKASLRHLLPVESIFPDLRRITNTMLPLIVLETPRLLPLSNWSLKRSCMMEYCLRKVTGPSSSARLARRALPSAFFADGTSPATRAVKVAPNAPLQKARFPCCNLWSVSDRCNQRELLPSWRTSTTLSPSSLCGCLPQASWPRLVDYERGCEDSPSRPRVHQTIETLFKRLDITYETALAKHRERHPALGFAEIPFYTRPGPDEMLYTTRNTFKPLADSSSRASRAVFEQNATDEDYKMTIHPFDTDDVPFPISRSPSPAPPSPPQVPHQKARLSSPRESSPPRTQAAYPAVQDDVPSYLREKNPQVASQLPPHHYLDKRVLVQESKPPSAGHRKGPLSTRPPNSARLRRPLPLLVFGKRHHQSRNRRPLVLVRCRAQSTRLMPFHHPLVLRIALQALPSRGRLLMRTHRAKKTHLSGTNLSSHASMMRFSLTPPPPSSAARNYFSSTADQQKPRNRPVHAPSLEDEEAASPTVFDESTADEDSSRLHLVSPTPAERSEGQTASGPLLRVYTRNFLDFLQYIVATSCLFLGS
ncbi:hypothetical protein B0H13DRAFT_2338794 [Mycena leptocephala]|nr:hypothetical protein B0H13DRAFT_2338794 [Mycena leptocephala]